MEPLCSQPLALSASQLALTHDKHFALHGEIWLLIIVVLFALFFAYILFCPRFRNWLLVSLRSRSVTDVEDKAEDDEEEEVEDYSRRVNEKHPV
ncbi:hypothetical protein ES288_A03G040500v1 [Gossypium darwinii]|uniref:Uncharacterized protein n=1 Tax=Gossypium darwinii TaxID=34276 RepID=A0A5D2H080_GOSDA|nr:hypothetical protein ES288_A03G040500v1 [Gossypium darwinii]